MGGLLETDGTLVALGGGVIWKDLSLLGRELRTTRQVDERRRLIPPPLLTDGLSRFTYVTPFQTSCLLICQGDEHFHPHRCVLSLWGADEQLSTDLSCGRGCLIPKMNRLLVEGVVVWSRHKKWWCYSVFLPLSSLLFSSVLVDLVKNQLE